MSKSNTLRYPEEFGEEGPVVDYLRMDFVRRDYEKPDRSYKKADGFDPIYINIPQKVTEAISQQFNQSGLGTTGEFFGSPTVQGGGNAFLSSARRLIEEFALNKSVDIANKLGATNLSAAGLLSASSGVVFNPNLEVLYEGPDFRKFNFQFNLFTKSKADAEQIYKIVKRLRLASLPSTNGNINTSQLSGVFQDASQGILAVASGQAAGGAVSGLFNYFTKKGGSGNSGKTGSWWKKTQGAGQSTAAGAAQAAIPSAGDAAALAGVSTLLGSQTGLFGAGASAGASGSRFITQPPFVMLTYMRGAKEHPFLMPLLPAAIDQINFDFTPTGNYTVVGDLGHDKKATTVGVTITMSLTEVTNLFQETATKIDLADNSFAVRSPKYSPF